MLLHNEVIFELLDDVGALVDLQVQLDLVVNLGASGKFRVKLRYVLLE